MKKRAYEVYGKWKWNRFLWLFKYRKQTGWFRIPVCIEIDHSNVEKAMEDYIRKHHLQDTEFVLNKNEFYAYRKFRGITLFSVIRL